MHPTNVHKARAQGALWKNTDSGLSRHQQSEATKSCRQVYSVPFYHFPSTIKRNLNQRRMVKGAYVYTEILRSSFAEKYPYRGAGYTETSCRRIRDLRLNVP